MDRNFLPSQNGREEVLRARGSDVKHQWLIQTKEYKVFEASLIPFAICNYIAQVPPSCMHLSLLCLQSPTDQIPASARSHISFVTISPST